MTIPRYEEMKAFERGHFTLAEQLTFAREAMALPRAEGMSPDDSTLTGEDYGCG